MKQIAQDISSRMYVKKRRRSGLRRGFLTCIIGEKDKSGCVSYFFTVPYLAGNPLLARTCQRARFSMLVKEGNLGWEKDFVIKETNGLIVEWDIDKNEINKRKHGISFEAAALVFADENYLELYDDEHSIDEDRYVAIGMVDDVLFVVYTMRDENVRMSNSSALGFLLLLI